MNKLPKITLVFWIMKICATTLGETAWDLLAQTMKVGYATSTIILMSIFVITLIAQLFSKRHYPFLYWAVILSTSTAGTTMSDYMDRTLGLGYGLGTAILISILIIIFIFWKKSGATLDVHNIKTTRIEALYWIAILFSNTLGTALGDFLADSSGLGFGWWALLIWSLISLTVLAKYYTKISPIVLFWIAFVLTRPFGATFGDLMTKSHEKWWLAFGTMGSSAVLLWILLIFVIQSAYIHWKKYQTDRVAIENWY